MNSFSSNFQSAPILGSVSSLLNSYLTSKNPRYQPVGAFGINTLGQLTSGQSASNILSSPSLWGQLGGTLASIATQGRQASPLLNVLAAIGSSQIPNIFSGQGFNINQITSPGALGSLGGALGATIGGRENPWAGSVGQFLGTIASPLLRGENVFQTLGNTGALQGLLGNIGGMLGGRVGGAAGTIGGNILRNIFSGVGEGQNLGNIISNIGSISNITGLAGGLLPFLLPRDIDPVAKSIISSASSMVLPTMAGAAAPTLGSTIGSLGLGSTLGASLGPVLSSLPVGAVALPIALGLGIWSDLQAQSKARSRDEKETYLYNKSMQEAAPKFEPLYQAILDAGKQRMTAVNAYLDDYIKKLLSIDPFLDVESIRNSALQKLGIVDKTYGFTEDELAALFGVIQPEVGLWGDFYTSPDPWARSSYSKHIGQAPWTVAQGRLMSRQGIDYSKIIPWLTARTNMMSNYGRYMTDPEFKAAIDNMLTEYAPLTQKALEDAIRIARINYERAHPVDLGEPLNKY